MSKKSRRSCLKEHTFEIKLVCFLIGIVLFGIVCLIDYCHPRGVTKIVAKIRSSTRIEIEPRYNIFISLTIADYVHFDRDSVQRMDLPSKITITDVNTIGQFAKLIETSHYRKVSKSEYAYDFLPGLMTITLFKDDYAIESFQMDNVILLMPEYGTFRTNRETKDLHRELRAILPYGQVLENIICRRSNLISMGIVLSDAVDDSVNTSAVGDKWCDYLVEYVSGNVDRMLSRLDDLNDVNEEYEYAEMLDINMIDVEGMIQGERDHEIRIKELLGYNQSKSPQCPYALNSQYQKDSPGDTIIVFETEPGWNKCGGPELLSSSFTDPNGCFLYYEEDMTVKFISNAQIERIKEEAQKLARQNRPMEFRYSTLLKIIEPEKAK